MKINNKNIVVLILVLSILVVSFTLVKMTLRKELFKGDPYSMQRVIDLIENATKIKTENSSISNYNQEMSNKLDVLEKKLELIKKSDIKNKLMEAEEKNNREYLVLKCSPNSVGDMVDFKNSPDIESQADANREILDSIHKELENLA